MSTGSIITLLIAIAVGLVKTFIKDKPDTEPRKGSAVSDLMLRLRQIEDDCQSELSQEDDPFWDDPTAPAPVPTAPYVYESISQEVAEPLAAAYCKTRPDYQTTQPPSGHSIAVTDEISDHTPAIPRKSRRNRHPFMKDFTLEKAVVYSEILNRKF
ncbi:MAG: hypothetical protein LBR06_02510 [Bacteroidales bacterium]|jgi:hypothetical protein|nr:hypothetical protein [Bacteroidales bacterium]